jgi:hypothetical protein
MCSSASASDVPVEESIKSGIQEGQPRAVSSGAVCEPRARIIRTPQSRLVIADSVGVKSTELTDKKLAAFCDSDLANCSQDQILLAQSSLVAIELRDCCKIADIRCLTRLDNMIELNLSGCTGLVDKQGCVPCSYDVTTLVDLILAHSSLTRLDASHMGLTDRGSKRILQAIWQLRCADGQQFAGRGWMSFHAEVCKNCVRVKDEHMNGTLTAVDLSW